MAKRRDLHIYLQSKVRGPVSECAHDAIGFYRHPEHNPYDDMFWEATVDTAQADAPITGHIFNRLWLVTR